LNLVCFRPQSFDFWRSMISHRFEIPYTLHFIYEGFDVAMTSLNAYVGRVLIHFRSDRVLTMLASLPVMRSFWFYKMVRQVMRRFGGGKSKQDGKVKAAANGTKTAAPGSRVGFKQKEL
jgi:hypothetical protein